MLLAKCSLVCKAFDETNFIYSCLTGVPLGVSANPSHTSSLCREYVVCGPKQPEKPNVMTKGTISEGVNKANRKTPHSNPGETQNPNPRLGTQPPSCS